LFWNGHADEDSYKEGKNVPRLFVAFLDITSFALDTRAVSNSGDDARVAKARHRENGVISELHTERELMSESDFEIV
jgi:hypothetical protein